MQLYKKISIIIPNKSNIKTLCVDNFAFKKKHKYGTIFIDGSAHKIVEIIESRESDVVTEVLKKYDNLDMVSRDGSWTYNKAIYNANDSIKQISDRFHLIKNMTEKCCEVIAKNLANRIQVTITEKHLDEYAEFLMMSKDEKIQLIKEKHSKGMGRMQLATKYHLGLKIVDAYLESKQKKTLFLVNKTILIL